MKKFEHGGKIYDAVGEAEKFFDFSANINPLGISEKILSALKKNLSGIVNYPDADATELKFAISNRYKIPAENLILLNGAAEFFYLYLNVLRPKKILLPVPTFSEYERAAISANAQVEYFFLREEENFQLDTEKFLSQIKSSNADCVILGRPNNPTGNLISLDEVKKISAETKTLVDESFIDFLEIESARNFADKNLTIVQSLTKIFAIPGLRLGFAVAEKNFAEKLNFSKDVWNVNFLAQKAGVAALNDEKFLADTKSWLEVEKKFFVAQLKNLPIKFFAPTVNFILMKFETEKISETVLQKLHEKKILLRSCENFVGLDKKFLRSAIRSRSENIFLLENLKKILLEEI